MNSSLRTGLRLGALALGVGHAGFLFYLGSQLPADDIIWGDLGVCLTTGSLVVATLTLLAWFRPLAGGVPLMALGGLLGAVGFGATIPAGVIFGAPFVSGFLFVGSRLEPEQAPEAPSAARET